MKVLAGETFITLVVESVIHLWLCFLNWPAMTAQQLPDTGARRRLGIRYVEVERRWMQAAAARALFTIH